ncbi:MAG: LysR family transcriptional regulator [Clostridia bacterium]|nr:LysR family transcriptional regulator [Clostridia bacterium]
MDFQQLKSFIQVAESRSITKAADLLFMSVSALKQQMDTLEAEVGVPLLIRSPKGVTLTPSGKYFYGKVSRLTNGLNDIIFETRNINTDTSKAVYIGFRHMKIMDYLYPEFIMSFFKSHPDITVTLVDMNETSYKNVDLLICDYIGFPEFSEYYPLRTMPVQCIMSGSHPLASKTAISIQDLRKYHLIVPPMPILKSLTPELAKATTEMKLIYEETLLNKDIIYINLIPSDNILLTFGDEKYLNSVLVQIPLEGYSIDYGIHTRREITKPVVRTFLDAMVSFYESHK